MIPNYENTYLHFYRGEIDDWKLKGLYWKRTALLLLFVIAAVTCNISAQSIEKEDIIYLKNGNRIKGIIIKHEFGTLSVKTADSLSHQQKTIIIQQGDIANIKHRPIANQEISPYDSILVYSESIISGGKLTNQPAKKYQPIASENLHDLMIPELIKNNTIQQFVPQSRNNIIAPITEEKPMITNTQTGGASDNFDPFSVPRPKRKSKIWNREIKGYRGFVDYGYIQGIGNNINNRLEFATSHGYQFNPIFYIGIGAAFDLTMNKKDSSLPLFFNTRINFLDEYTTPFWDVRSGYSFRDGKGFYFSTAFGISFTKKGKNSINLGLVYSLQNAKYYRATEANSTETTKFNLTYHGLALRLTYEF